MGKAMSGKLNCMGTSLVLFLSTEYLIPTRTMGSGGVTEISLCMWTSCGFKKSEKSSLFAVQFADM